MRYYDIESGEAVTIDQLYAEYIAMQTAQPEEYPYSFDDYVGNCLTRNNGTLEPITEEVTA